MVMMEKTKITDIVAFTDRRLHPVRLAVGHLNRLLASNKGGASIAVDQALLESVTATLELFVEDFEASTQGREEKKSADTPRVAQTRVG
jgi:hypothetical protein